jgi:hypothetical protein
MAAPKALLVNPRVFDDRVFSPEQAPLHGRLHDLVKRLPVQAHDFRHLGDIAESLQPDDDRLCQQFGDALVTVRPRHRDLLDTPVPMLHARDICLDDRFKLAGIQVQPSPLRSLVHVCCLLGLGMRPFGRPVHLRRDDNPFGLHVEFHVHDLPRSGNPKNLTVKISAFHRESLADPGHLPQGFPPNFIKIQDLTERKISPTTTSEHVQEFTGGNREISPVQMGS